MENFNIFEMLYETYKIKNDNPLRVIEFFGGYGSQTLALKYLGVKYEHWKLCEWAVPSIIAYASVHRNELKEYGKNFCKELSKEQIVNFLFECGVSTDYNKPATLEQIKRIPEEKLRLCYNSIKWANNLVDISRVKGNNLEIANTDKYTYLLTYSFPCGLAGTKIITKNGYKNIEDVTTNDYVLTHKNRFKKVAKTMERVSNHYYELKGLGVPKLFLTEEHPLYVFRGGKEQWIKVKDLKETDMFSFNVNQKNIDVDLSNETLWLLGRYVADGWINEALYNSVEFAIAFKKEKEFLENIPKNFLEKFKRNTKSCYEYRIADKNFQNYCKQFGSGAKNKKIPQWVIDLPKEKLQCFFNGYISGDGHIRFRKKVKQIMFSTVSENLFLSMQQIVAKLYSCICSCYIRKDDRKETFNDSYNCQFNDINNHRDQIINNDKIYTKIKKIERYNKEVKVYNFEVEEDNSYTCQNVIVHNCQDLSLAGKCAGMEKGSGTRSGLLWEVERILSECENKPQILLMENVTQVHGAGNEEHFKQWLLRLEEMGYQSYWQDLSATEFKIPQTRNRTFMVSILGNYNYTFPKKTKLELRLKDLLEPKGAVDEKFYISDKMINYISKTGANGFNNKDAKINLDIARPLTTDPNKRAGTTNYLSSDFPENFDLSKVHGTKNRAELLLLLLSKNGELEKHDLPNGCDSSLNNPKIREVSNTITTRYDAGIQNQQQIGMCVVEKAKRLGGLYDKNGETHQAGSIYDSDFSSPTLDCSNGGGNRQPFIVEKGEKNKSLKETLEKTELENVKDVAYLDTYNRNAITNGTAKTILTGVDYRNHDFLLIKNATKKGYLEATIGDGIDISSRMESHRGTVQKGKAQTLTTMGGGECRSSDSEEYP